MSDHLRIIRLDSPGLLSKLEDYSSLLAAFTPSIISEILKELGKTDVNIVEDLNVGFMTSYHSFHQIFTGLMQPTSVEFKKVRAFALLNAAMHEKDVSRWSPYHFETLTNYVLSILGDSKRSNSQKLEFIMQLVPKLIQLLEKTTLWKADCTFFSKSFRVMFESISCFANPGFFENADYQEGLKQFPMSGFPPTLQELPAFVKSKLWDNYNKLKDQ
jgi:hypothetical protein